MNTHKHLQLATLIITLILVVFSILFTPLVFFLMAWALPLGVVQYLGSFYYGVIKRNSYMMFHFITSTLVIVGLLMELFPLGIGLPISALLAGVYWMQTFMGIKYIRPHNVLDLE